MSRDNTNYHDSNYNVVIFYDDRCVQTGDADYRQHPTRSSDRHVLGHLPASDGSARPTDPHQAHRGASRGAERGVQRGGATRSK